MNDKKLISVVLPVYNCKEYINDSVQSILKQTYKNFELIIVDDGSDDGTLEILNNFKDKRIRLYKNKYNRGLIYSLNRALNKSKGQFIARMDADDICELNRFQKQINYLNKNIEISVVGSAVTLIDNNNRVNQKYLYPYNDNLIKWSMFFSCSVCHPSVMIRSDVFKKINRYSLTAKFAEDYDLWSQLIKKKYKFSNLQDSLLKLRKHKRNVSIKNFNAHFLMGARISQKIIQYNFKFAKKKDFKIIKCIFSLGKYQKEQSDVSIIYIFKILKYFVIQNINNLSLCDLKMIKKSALIKILKIWIRNIYRVNLLRLFQVIFNIIYLELKTTPK
jgi:glycosyltransferase involved in cell wall biosynthesis